MPFDNAYEAITEENDHTHWAFGTGFDDPLSGVDTSVPAGVDGAALAAYCVMLGDDALVTDFCAQEKLDPQSLHRLRRALPGAAPA